MILDPPFHHFTSGPLHNGSWCFEHDSQLAFLNTFYITQWYPDFLASCGWDFYMCTRTLPLYSTYFDGGFSPPLWRTHILSSMCWMIWVIFSCCTHLTVLLMTIHWWAPYDRGFMSPNLFYGHATHDKEWQWWLGIVWWQVSLWVHFSSTCPLHIYLNSSDTKGWLKAWACAWGSTRLYTNGPFRMVYRVMPNIVCHNVFAHTLNLRCLPYSWTMVLHTRWYTHWILFIPLESSMVLRMPTFAHQIQVLLSMQCWFHTLYNDYAIDFDARICSILDWHLGDFHNCLRPKPFRMASMKVCFLFLGEGIDNLFTFDMVSFKQFPLKVCLLHVLIKKLGIFMNFDEMVFIDILRRYSKW